MSILEPPIKEPRRGDHEKPGGRGKTRSELSWEAADTAELAAWLF